MLKVGMLGYGSIAKSHTKAYQQLKKENAGVEVVAYCDIRPEQMEGLEGVRKYTDMEEFLEKESGQLDYVDICLPTYLHAEAAIKAMKAGFHVLSEKPMALNYEQAQEMYVTAKETGKQLMVAHCNRFMGASKMIKKYVQSGELGKVRHAEYYREGGHPDNGYQDWFSNGALSGGAMLDLHIHDVDVIYDTFGMPEAVSAAAAVVIPGSGYDTMSVNYMYPDGMYINAKCDWTIKNDKFNTRACRVNFEKGYLFMDRSPGRQVFVKVDETGTEDLWDQVDLNMFYNEIVYFVDCLRNGKPVELCRPEASAEAVRIIMAEMKSADLGGERIQL